jgi:hypothetical protein
MRLVMAAPMAVNGHGQVRSASVTQIADQLVSELAGCHVVCIGPVVLGDATITPRFYCAVCSSDDAGFFSLICGGEDLGDAQRARVAVRDRLRNLGRCVLTFESEAEMAREAEKLWPSERTTQIRQLVENGR